MNYDNQAAMKAQFATTEGMIERGQLGFSYDPTVEENIDKRITAMKAEIKRLEESKESLRPLLAMRISDIRSAMNY